MLHSSDHCHFYFNDRYCGGDGSKRCRSRRFSCFSAVAYVPIAHFPTFSLEIFVAVSRGRGTSYIFAAVGHVTVPHDMQNRMIIIITAK